MVKSLKKFGGALMLYAVIFFGILAIASRINYVEGHNTIMNDEVVAFQK